MNALQRLIEMGHRLVAPSSRGRSVTQLPLALESSVGFSKAYRPTDPSGPPGLRGKVFNHYPGWCRTEMLNPGGLYRCCATN